jgi:hypothetical protein
MTRWETLLSPDGSSMQAQPATKATSHVGNARRMAGEHPATGPRAPRSGVTEPDVSVGGTTRGGYDVDEPRGLRAREIIEGVGRPSHRAGAHSG